MPTKCTSFLKGRRIRLTRLDGCGRPVYGECSTVVSKGFVSVGLTANTTDSDEISVTNAAGEVCVYEPAETSFTNYSVEITFCEVDPDLFALATGQSTYEDSSGDSAGFTVNSGVDLTGQGFALELWAGAGGGDACADGGEGNYGYILLPFVRGGIIGDFTVENGAVTFTLTGGTTRDGNTWGVGPYDDVMDDGTGSAGPLITALDVDDHLLVVSTSIAPPDAVCGCQELVEPAFMQLQEAIEKAANADTGPAVVPKAQGATAGSPGTFTPAGSRPPKDLDEMKSVVAKPKTKWADDQYVETQDGNKVLWTGAAWGAWGLVD